MSRLVLLVFVLLPSAWAQGTSAQLVGRIADPSGAAVPGVDVKIENTDTGFTRQTTTAENGAYAFPLLPPGNYKLTTGKDGFRPQSRTGINLAVDQVARLDLELEIGAMTQEVSVTATAPLLEQETSALGQVIDNRKIQNIPLNGRSAFRLVTLTPGIMTSPSSSGQFGDIPVNTNFDGNFSINGGRQMSNEVQIDGVPSTTGQFNTITTIPSIEATQEFKVQSNNLNAEWGRFSGGVVNVSTRSGTNQIHGSLYEYLRNNVFDANEFFNKTAGRGIPAFHMNQFGGAAGGPIRKNRTFFFADYQGTRWRRGDSLRVSVPTALQRQGDFSQTRAQNGQSVTIYDPQSSSTNRTPFAGNVLPASRIDPIARKLLDYYPAANATGDPNTLFNNYANNAGRAIDGDQVSGRVDHNVTNAWRAFGRFATNKTSLTQPDSYGNVATPDPGAVGPDDVGQRRPVAALADQHVMPVQCRSLEFDCRPTWPLGRVGEGVGPQDCRVAELSDDDRVHSGQAELGQQRRDVPVGVDRHRPPGAVDLPDIHSGDVERTAGGRHPGREPLTGVGAGHPPLLGDPIVGGVDEWFADRMEGHVGEAAPGRGEEPGRPVAIGDGFGQRRVQPLDVLGDHV